MRNFQPCVAALTLLVSALTVQAHEFDPGGRIVVTCQAGSTASMANVARAVEDSHYWAPRSTRREMLALARQACALGSTTVTFVPTPDQRYGTAADSRVALNRAQSPNQQVDSTPTREKSLHQ